MKPINLIAIQNHLFSAKAKLCRDFGLAEEPRDAKHLSDMLLIALKQPVLPVKRVVTNDEVFEAAVRSIGSNSRPWATFISKEPLLRELLHNYEPLAVADMDVVKLRQDLRQFFPGQPCTGDTRAVVAWANKLAATPSFYNNVILSVVNGFETLHGQELNDDQLIILLSGFLSAPSLRWKGFNNIMPIFTKEVYKLNGMGFPLASEFLRNLGWNGFKPDRHIIRLLSYWYDVNSCVSPEEIRFYTDLIGSENKGLVEMVKYSLLGQKISPHGVRFSEVDNFIWALGANVMTKGKEQNLTNVN